MRGKAGVLRGFPGEVYWTEQGNAADWVSQGKAIPMQFWILPFGEDESMLAEVGDVSNGNPGDIF